MDGVQKMKLPTMLRRILMALCAVLLGGCGYASYPGIVVETKEFPLSDKATLTVTRHLDGWKTGSLFRFEWYVVKCKSDSGREISLLQDMVLRGTYSSEIPKERIRTSEGRIGYIFFDDIVVFDNDCNKISYFNPWSEEVINQSTIRPDYRINSAVFEQSGSGSIHLSWALKEGGVRELIFKTNDFGVHWTSPQLDINEVDDVRVVPPTAENISAFGEIVAKLVQSGYVVISGELTSKEQGIASTSTSLSRSEEFNVLKKGLEMAKTVAIVRDGAKVVIVDRNVHYEIIIANPDTANERKASYVYAAKILVNKKSSALVRWRAEATKAGATQ